MTLQSLDVRKSGFLMSAALLSVCMVSVVAGKPPAPPAPPPPGTVFYQDPLSGFWNWQMKADGSGKSVVLNNGNGSGTFDASFYTYGADQARWCLQDDGGEITAFRTPAGSTGFNARIQVTAFRPEVVPGEMVKWSNGGDAFISFGGF